MNVNACETHSSKWGSCSPERPQLIGATPSAYAAGREQEDRGAEEDPRIASKQGWYGEPQVSPPQRLRRAEAPYMGTR